MGLFVDIAGCCFLTYTTRQEADTAIEIFHNKRTLQPVKQHSVLSSSLVW